MRRWWRRRPPNGMSTASSAATSTLPRSASSATITYYNDGDWVESCTALVEHADGAMEILDWAERRREEAMRERAAAATAKPIVAAEPVPA